MGGSILMPSSHLSVDSFREGPFAIGSLAVMFLVPKLLMTLKKNGHLPLYPVTPFVSFALSEVLCHLLG